MKTQYDIEIISDVINHPNNEPISPNLYKLEQDYSIDIRISDKIYTFVIKKGFLYDGASVPRIVWTLTGLTKDGLLRAGALVHDAIYFPEGNLTVNSKDIEVYYKGVRVNLNLSRKQADIIFKKILEKCKVSKRKVFIVYHSVRIGGIIFWS
jgi:hypothetical protein